MNLGENLQNLRKQNGLSQEELAEQLDVSRQAVSKWESNQTYPEIEKIMLICDLFHCSMDTLVKGTIKEESDEKQEYDTFMMKFGKGISFAIFLILVGVTLLLTVMAFSPNKESLEEYTMIGVIFLFVFIAMAVPIFIILGIKMEHIKQKYKNLYDIYTKEEKEEYNQKFSITIAFSVSMILVGVVIMLTLYGLHIFNKNSLFPIAIFMVFITGIVPVIVKAGIEKEKFEMTILNNIKEQNASEALIGKISAVIMISATIIYFILGFVMNLWKINWILFPIGGMLCGIVSIVLNKEN